MRCAFLLLHKTDELMMNNKLLKRTMTTDMVVALVSGTLPEKHGVAELFVTTVLARGDGEDIR